MNANEVLRNRETQIIDVRTPAEFMGGNVAGSINIPLQEIPENLDRLKGIPQPFVVCCASGNRSGQAQNFLNQMGISCVNGGSWTDVNYLIAKNS